MAVTVLMAGNDAGLSLQPLSSSRQMHSNRPPVWAQMIILVITITMNLHYSAYFNNKKGLLGDKFVLRMVLFRV